MKLIDALCATHWAMDAVVFDQMRAILERHTDGVKLSSDEIKAAIGRAPGVPNPKNRKYEVHQGTALVPVQGTISKHASSVGDISQAQGASAQDIQDNIRTALADPDVVSILLCIESPGGQVDGTQATADVVRAAAAKKPTWAFIDGLGCSAAYWIASAASRVIATPASRVGSIGVIAAMRDTSKADEKAGYRTIVVRSGPMKAPGQRGEAITDAQVQPMQDVVNGMAEAFFTAVGAARGLSGDALDAVTDGRDFLAKTAKQLGLIDAVQSYEDVLADISNPMKRAIKPISLPQMSNGAAQTGAISHPSPVSGRQPQGTTAMQIAPEKLNDLTQKHKGNAAIMGMIVAMATGADGKPPASESDITSAIAAAELTTLRADVARLSKDLETAQSSLTTERATTADKLVKLDAEIVTLKAAVAEKDTAIANLKKGHQGGIETKKDEKPGASAKEAYEAKIAELKKSGIKDPYREMVAKHPELHQAMLAEANAEKGAAK